MLTVLSTIKNSKVCYITIALINQEYTSTTQTHDTHCTQLT